MINGWSIFPCPSFFTIAMLFWVCFFSLFVFSRLLLLSICFIIFHCFELHPLSVSFYYTFNSNDVKMFKAIFSYFLNDFHQKSVLQIFVCIHNHVFAFVPISFFFPFHFRSAYSTGCWTLPKWYWYQLIFIVWLNFSDAVLFVVILSISLSWSADRSTIKRKAIERVSSFNWLDIGHLMLFILRIEWRKTLKKKKPNILMMGFIMCHAWHQTQYSYDMLFPCHVILSLRCAQMLTNLVWNTISFFWGVEWFHFILENRTTSAKIPEYFFNLILVQEKEFISFHL